MIDEAGIKSTRLHYLKASCSSGSFCEASDAGSVSSDRDVEGGQQDPPPMQSLYFSSRATVHLQVSAVLLF